MMSLVRVCFLFLGHTSPDSSKQSRLQALDSYDGSSPYMLAFGPRGIASQKDIQIHHLARPGPDTCSALASVLQAAHPGLGPAGCCPVLKTGRDLFPGRLTPAGGVHPRPEPAVPAQPES